MAVNRVRKNGSYAPLSIHYYKDEAVIAVGEAAELLFVRSLAFCAETLSDGFVARNQVRFLAVGISKPALKVKKLVQEGLWTEVEGGWVVTSWLSWNASREEILGAQEKDRQRKKPQVKGTPPPSGPSGGRKDSVRNPRGVRAESERLAGGRAGASSSSSSSSSSTSKNPPGSPSVAELPPGNPAGRRDDELPATLLPSKAEMIRSWIDAYTANTDCKPTDPVKNQAGKEIGDLIKAGNDPILILEAAKQAGAKGYATVAREIGPMNGRVVRPAQYRKPTPMENHDRIAAELEAEGWDYPPQMRVVNGDG